MKAKTLKAKTLKAKTLNRRDFKITRLSISSKFTKKKEGKERVFSYKSSPVRLKGSLLHDRPCS